MDKFNRYRSVQIHINHINQNKSWFRQQYINNGVRGEISLNSDFCDERITMIKKEYKYSELTAKIIGCAMAVHKVLGNEFFG